MSGPDDQSQPPYPESTGRPADAGRAPVGPVRVESAARGGAEPAHTLAGRPWDRIHVWQVQAIRDLLVLGAVVLLIWLGYAMRAVTTPLLIALALAYLFEPFVAWSTQRLRVGRPVIVGGLLGVLVTFAAVTLLLTAPLALRQTLSLIEDVRSGRLIQSVVNAENAMPETLREPYRNFLEMSGLLEAKERAVAAAKEREDAAAESDAPATPGKHGPPDATDGAHEAGDRPSPTESERPQRGAEGGSSEPSMITSTIEGLTGGTEGTGGIGGTGADVGIAGGTAGTTAQGVGGDVISRDAEGKPIRLGESDPTADASLMSQLFQVEPEEERIRRIVRDELTLTAVDQSTTGGSSRWLGFLHRGLNTAWMVLGAVIAIGLLLFLIPFYFFFFSVWWPTVTGFLGGLIPNANRPRAFELLGQMDRAVAGFVRGRLVISGIVALVLAIGWYSIGVPYSIVLALIVGVFNLVPYLSGIGLPIAIVLMAMEQLGVAPAERHTLIWILAAPTVVFVIAQLLDGYVLTPLIAGKATDLDPVTIVVAIIAGGTIAGMYGMLIAIPLAACLKIVIREILLPKVKAWTRGEASDPLPLSE